MKKCLAFTQQTENHLKSEICKHSLKSNKELFEAIWGFGYTKNVMMPHTESFPNVQQISSTSSKLSVA